MIAGAEVACGGCGQKNRMPFPKIGTQGKCGRCGARLDQPSAPIAIDDLASLRAAIGESSVPVLVDFWAPWCGPCRTVAPEVLKVASSHAGRWLVVKANTDTDPALGAAFRIRSIPTLAVFSGGREVGRDAGARPAAAIEAFVDRALSAAG